MLRTSLRSVRGPGGRSIGAAASRQWQAAASSPAWAIGKRTFADEKKVGSEVPQAAVIPPSETRTAASSTAPPPASSSSVEASEIPVENVPLTPPKPETVGAAKVEEPASIPPPPPLPKKKGFFRRLRNYVLTLSVLGALAFGGGVWYSRVNDNFHDFFTEYVPYGEQAVLYLEEMDFRKRFPRIAQRGGGAAGALGSKDADASVRIPAQSGASWRVADTDAHVKRETSAVKDAKDVAADKTAESAKAKAPAAASAVVKEDIKTSNAFVETAKPLDEPASLPAAEKSSSTKTKTTKRRSSSASSKAPATVAAAAAEPAAEPAVEPAVVAFKAPEVNEPSRWPPASPIDPLKVNDATEPVVQDLVKMLNDIITVINADGANERYGSTIGKAKQTANQLGQKIRLMKQAAQDEAAATVKQQIDRLETHAADLIARIESHMAAQESRWRQEFESEMGQVQETFDKRLSTMTERERQIAEQKLQNRLLEQAVELQRSFAKEVKERVEAERNSRLGQLESLSAAVSELDKLTSNLNDVVDSSKRTQQLHLAVDAVRASLEASSTGPAAPPRPFIRELVALKEIAAGDEVVDAAIASINPTAYQRGIPSTAELIDRFRRVASEVRKAALLPADAGVASHASSWALSKVMFNKKPGLAGDGDDVESVLARAQTFLEEGDLDAAAREVNGLQGWAKTLSRDWLGEVRKVLEVRQALDVIQTEARLQSLKVD